MTKFAAIPLLGVGLTLAGFGVIRGAMDAGPGAGTRLVLGIAPPVDEDVREMAVHIAKARVEEKGAETRVVPAGDRIVVELDTTDPELVKDTSDLLGRTARVELHVVMPNDAWPAADYVANDDQAKRLGIHVAMGCRGREEDGKRHCIVRGDHILATYLAAIPALAVPHGQTLAYGRADEIRPHAWRTNLLDSVVLAAGPEIRHVELGDGGVILQLTDEAARRVVAPASTRPGVPVATV